MKRRARRFVREHATAASAVVVLFCFAAFLGALAEGSSKGSVAVTSGVLSPPPSFPGENFPNVYFQINYTGPGDGGYTYTVDCIRAGVPFTQTGYVLVRSGSPFAYYLYDPPPQQGFGTVSISVYSGASVQPSKLVYQAELRV